MSSGESEESKSVSSALAVLCKKDEQHFMFEAKGIIGRSPTAFLCIPDSHISRKHCVIERAEDNTFTICDLSNFGTFVNNKRLITKQPQELHHLDRINLAGMSSHTYVFLMNKKQLGIRSSLRTKSSSPLAEKMIDLNETQSLEKYGMDKELNLVETEINRLKGELQEKLKAREEEFERERLKASLESAHNKEQADKAELMLKETMMEKESIMTKYELKIADTTKKVEELQKTKSEMEMRHQTEREELENKCKAEIEDLKKKLETSETKHQQFEELQARLEETKSILLESELEQQRLFEAKVEVESKLESKIVDLTNERVHKEGQVKELEEKLKKLEEVDERVKKEIEGLEDDMMCSICAELYIEPTALSCGHMFCKMCINEWSKKKKICPMCRAKISTTVRIFNMDSVIERNVCLMSDEVKIRRQAIIAERKQGKTPHRKQSAKKRRRESSHPRGPSPESVAAVRMRVSHENHENFQRMAIRPRMVPFPHLDTEGDDPFQMGWVTNQLLGPPGLLIRPPAERNSPVTVAAVDLTTSPMVDAPPASRVRTHTVTSPIVDATIVDLTNM